MAEQLKPELKKRLQEIAKWEPCNFPNGSSYRKQFLPGGNFGDLSIRVVYNAGYEVTEKDGAKSWVLFDTVGVGKGVDLGVHFCSQDQALAALV